MKKLLLSLIAFCGFTAMNAEEVTFDFTNPESFGVTRAENSKAVVANEFTKENVTVSIAQGENLSEGQELRFFTSAKGAVDFRCSEKGGQKNHQMTISTTNGGVITSIEFTASNFNFTATPGTLEAKNWTGSAPSVTFTTTNKNNLTTMKVTYSTGGVVKEAAALKFAETEFNVMLGSEFTAPELTKATTAPAIYSSSNEEVATVDEETGNVTIIAAGQTTITATTAENEAYYAGEASYTINVVDGSKKAKSIAEIITFEDDAQFVVDFPMTVAFKSYYNTFATDGENFIQIYDKAQPDYNVGDVIPAGWVTKYKLYNSTTPELLPVSTLPEATETVEFTPAIVTEVTNADVNKVLKLQGVVLAEASPAGKANFTGTVNGVEFNFRNNYEKASVEAGTYDITFVVTIYQNAPSLYVIEYSQDTSGIESVEADDNAPVEYFNLQGVRVANPENGLFIRRQGNKVEKVVIR